MTSTCPRCGSAVRVVGDPVEGTMHYEAIQFTTDDLWTFAQCIDVTLAAGLLRDSLKPITQEHLEELKTRTLSLAFMEVSRDA